MDMRSVGNFLAALRKERGLTQEQLGEQMGVTNKTVSRWETGAYLPSADALLWLSAFYDVSVNELLAGQRLDEAQYREAAEERLTEAVRTGSFGLRERIAFFKRKWRREHLALLILLGFAATALFVTGLVTKNPFLAGGTPILALVLHGVLNNAMMAYVERNAFDGSGS